MSVINQMLKDLEQRTPEQGQAATPLVQKQKSSTVKIVLISVAVLVSLNLLGFYIWDLQKQVASSEQQVKNYLLEQDESDQIAKEKIPKAQQINQVKLNESSPQPTKEILASSQQIIKQDKAVPAQAALPKVEVIPKNTSTQQPITQKQTNNTEQTNVVETVQNNVSKVTKLIAKPAEKLVEKQAVKRVDNNEPVTRFTKENTPTESKMTVSRRQLTAQELISQKLARAEKAIKNNDIVKAEKLFEETLIIEPNHKQARKKLAALWFGRKSYQQAINLLSQGISLDSNDAELRLLKARIYLQQGKSQAAYNTLKPLSMLKHQDYQVMLANVAQQIEQYESAIQAYKVLIEMQSYSGRWHLGLAIIYDKNSQFSLAATEYATALTKSDLSIASAKFAQQRMQALGE